jgi:hypothetical protein
MTDQKTQVISNYADIEFMHSTYKQILSLILALNIFQASIVYSQDTSKYTDTCKQLLEWIYKELTLKNFDKSVERTNKKLLASMLITLKNNKSIKLQNHPNLLVLWKSMKELDPKFEKFLKKNKPYRKFTNRGFFTQMFGGLILDDVDSVNYFDAIESWSNLQTTNPEYFKGLPTELKLDKWDLVTAKLIEDAGKVKYENNDKVNVLKEITSLSNRLKRLAIDHSELIALDNVGIHDIKKSLDYIQKNIVNKIKKISKDNKGEFSKVCNEKDFETIINQSPENYVCPIEITSSNSLTLIQNKLVKLANVIPNIDQLNLVYKPEVPVLASEVDNTEAGTSAVDKLCPVEIDYMKVKKPSPNATYNMRSNSMVDTVVIHHTGTATKLKTSAEVIHRGHIDRTTDNDAWYMVGYNYLISLGGNGATIKKPAIIKGRDSNFRGAHAGGNTLPLPIKEIEKLMNTYQFYNCKQILDDEYSSFPIKQVQKKNICEDGVENRSSSYDYNCGALASNIAALSKNGAISGNMTSIGVAIIGNFAKHSGKSFMGKKLYNSKTLNVSQVKTTLIPKLVKLITALKKDYPGIKRIVPHSYFNNSECPGTVRNILHEVSTLTGLEVYLTKTEDKKANDYKYSSSSLYKNYLKTVTKITAIEKKIIKNKTSINSIEIKSDMISRSNLLKVRSYQNKIKDLLEAKSKLVKTKNRLLASDGDK